MLNHLNHLKNLMMLMPNPLALAPDPACPAKAIASSLHDRSLLVGAMEDVSMWENLPRLKIELGSEQPRGIGNQRSAACKIPQAKPKTKAEAI